MVYGGTNWDAVVGTGGNLPGVWGGREATVKTVEGDGGEE